MASCVMPDNAQIQAEQEPILETEASPVILQNGRHDISFIIITNPNALILSDCYWHQNVFFNIISVDLMISI